MTRGQYLGMLLVLAPMGVLGGAISAGRSGSPAAAQARARVVKPQTALDAPLAPMPQIDTRQVQAGPPTIVQGYVKQLDVETSANGALVKVLIDPLRETLKQPAAVFLTDAILVSLVETAFATGDPVYITAHRCLSDEGKEVYVGSSAWMQDFEPLQYQR